MSVVSGIDLDNVGVRTRTVAVRRSYPIVIDRTRCQSGHVFTSHVADVQVLVPRYVIGERNVRGHIQPVTCRIAYAAPVRGEAIGSHVSSFLRPRSRWRRRRRSCRSCSWSRRCCSCRCRCWRRAGGRQLELADARKPVSAAGGRIIFVGMPESEIIDRIDGGHAVIPPASAGMGLVTTACGHDGFALTEIIQRIRSEPASIADGRLLAGGPS